ncbi:MAG: hypothetical protein KF770_24180 [Anaerolineae bacterium]|nr:hypothetical protein [Anaerolineae bacterium]
MLIGRIELQFITVDDPRRHDEKYNINRDIVARPYPPPISSTSSALATAVTPHLSHVTKRIGHGRTPHPSRQVHQRWQRPYPLLSLT